MVEVVAVAAVDQAVINAQTKMERLQIHVLVGVVQHLAQHRLAYFVILMDINVQHLVHRVEVEVEVLTAAKHFPVDNAQTMMARLQIHVRVRVVRHLAQHQTAYFVIIMDINVQHLVHRVEVEVLLVVQARQHLAVHNVRTKMDLLQIHVRVGVVRPTVQHQMG